MSADDKITPENGRSASVTAGPGRPAGARNKRSRELGELIARRHGATPGELLAATLMEGLQAHLEAGQSLGTFMSTRARALAIELGGTDRLAQAVGMLHGLAKELMPYVHQRLPQAIEVDSRTIVFALQAADGQVVEGGMGVLDMRPADLRTGSRNDENPAGSDAPGRTIEHKPLKGHEE